MSTPEYTEKDETMQALERMWPAVEKIKELKVEIQELKREIARLYEDKEYLVTLLSQANQRQREAA